MSSSFDALSYGSPLVAAWAEDPDWTAPADQGAVASWPNRGSLVGDFEQATAGKRPIYDVDAAGGKPGIVFTAADSDTLIAGGAFGVAAAAQTLVMVAKVSGDPAYVGSTYDAGLTAYQYASSATDVWAMGTAADFGVSVPGAPAATTLAVLEVSVPATGLGTVAVNGVTAPLTVADSPQAFDAVAVGSLGDTFFGDCTVAFVGVYPDATAPAGLVAGLLTHYGI